MRGRIVAQVVLAVAATGCGALTQTLTGENYTSTEGRYRVWFPSKPKIEAKTTPTPIGIVPAFMAMSEDRSTSLVRWVMYADYPPSVAITGNQDKVLDGFCEGWSRTSKLTILSQSAIAIDGHPGREVRFDTPAGKGRGRSRIYLVGSRLYQVAIIGLGAQDGSADGAMQSFLDSFALLEGTPPPTGGTGHVMVAGPPAVAPQPPPGMGPMGPRFGPQGMGPMGPRFGPQGMGPMGPRFGPQAGGPAPLPFGPPGMTPPTTPDGRPAPRRPGRGLGRRPRSGPASQPPPPQEPIADSGGQPAPAPTPAPDPNPAPAPGSDGTLAFYNIPDPASAAIEADIPDSRVTSRIEGPATSEGPTTSEGPAANVGAAMIEGAAIRSFAWVDEDTDRVGSPDAESKSNGTKDQHLQLALELPPSAILVSMTISCGGSQRWTTRPGDRGGPIAIYHRGQPLTRSQVAQVGAFSGPQRFDLYVDAGPGVVPAAAFELEVEISIGEGRGTLTGRCHRPASVPGLLVDARPAPPASAPPSPLLIPDRPASPPETSEPPPRKEPPAQPEVAPRPPRGGRSVTEVPVFLTPTGGGASILAFDWVGRDDDYVGTDGRRIAPGGGKDEHFRLVMDLPAAAIIEEVAILGAEVRWTTRPTPHSWPVAVVANQEVKNRRQSLRLGPFSGRWTFDLYAESQEDIHPGQPFGVEVVVFIGGSRHHLTARCQHR